MPTNTGLPGYPATGFGVKYHQVVDHKGPTSYPTGGETVNASDFANGGFDAVHLSGLSLSGTYFARLLWPSSSPGVSFKTFKLIWYVLATGVEVANAVDLSAEYLRLDLTMV